jgi:hypothetical protein
MKNAATAGIERDFPDWMAWVSRHGEYWGAVRRNPKPDLEPTVIADSEEELRSALAAPTRTRPRLAPPWPDGARRVSAARRFTCSGGQTPRERPMISFMISVVPPKMVWIRASW